MPFELSREQAARVSRPTYGDEGDWSVDLYFPTPGDGQYLWSSTFPILEWESVSGARREMAPSILPTADSAPGWFTFEGLAAGRYRVRLVEEIERGELLSEAAMEVAVAEDGQTFTLDVERTFGAWYASGRVLSLTPEIEAGVREERMDLWVFADVGQGTRAITARLDESGRFALGPLLRERCFVWAELLAESPPMGPGPTRSRTLAVERGDGDIELRLAAVRPGLEIPGLRSSEAEVEARFAGEFRPVAFSLPGLDVLHSTHLDTGPGGLSGWVRWEGRIAPFGEALGHPGRLGPIERVRRPSRRQIRRAAPGGNLLPSAAERRLLVVTQNDVLVSGEVYLLQDLELWSGTFDFWSVPLGAWLAAAHEPLGAWLERHHIAHGRIDL